MKELSKNWFVEGLVDFEYKKYILLDYLNQVHSKFNKKSLYPAFSDVIYHYKNLKEYIVNKGLLTNNFPKEPKRIDLKKIKIEYSRLVKNDELMDEIQSISEFAIEQFGAALSTGKEIYDFAESHLSIEPIGIHSMYVDEGYLFTVLPPGKTANIYFYKVRLFENNNDAYRGLLLNFVDSKSITISNTIEAMKIELIKQFDYMPNPASYVVSSSMKFPYKSTFLPIAKRLLIQKIAA